MLNPDEKETISLRVDHEKQQYYSTELWNKIFLVTCVIGVSIDPLFLYIPIINGDRKCLTVDQNMRYVSFVLRTATDIMYILHIIFGLRNALIMANELNISIFSGLSWSHLLIDVLAILPLPQIIVFKFFSKIAGTRSLMTRKFINFILLVQYIPRLIRVYLLSKELGNAYDSLARLVWVRAFLFFVYIIFAHIFGAFWYFYAIYSETACWHTACTKLKGCEPSTFDCQLKNLIRNSTYLNEFCPVNPPNPAVFDFGIFSNAIASKILLQSTDFPRKFFRCFWWGLKILSSFGQNLDTSTSVTENLFAITISSLGLLLFLYLIGNIQTYMQLATTKSEEARMKLSIKHPEIDSFLSSHKISERKKKVIKQYIRQTINEDKDFDVKRLFSLVKEYSVCGSEIGNFDAWVTKTIDMKKHDRNTSEINAQLWVSRNGFDNETKKKIMRYVDLRLTEGKDVDVASILTILPFELGRSIKRFLCFPILKKVPMLKNMDDSMYETICNYLKPVTFAEKSYIIRKDEPLDFILFLTQGVAWNFGSNTSSMRRLRKGEFYGDELLEWRVNSVSYSEFPISDANLKCHTKVEAFSLMANDLEHVLTNCWTKFSNSNEPLSEGLKPFAAASLQQGFQRFIRNKRAKERNDQLSIVTYNN